MTGKRHEEASWPSLQALIDTATSDTLALPKGTFVGPAVVRRSMHIVGRGIGYSVLTGGAPLLSTEGAGVVRVEGLTMSGAVAPTGRGAAVRVEAGRVEIVDCAIENHRAVLGGAIYAAGPGTLVMTRVALVGNRASKGGGALAVLGAARVVLTDVSFEENRALDAGHHIYAMRVGAGVPDIQLKAVKFSACLGRSTGIANVRGFEGRFTRVDTPWPADSLKVPQN
ncbi:MAG: hypothetical protein AAF449_15095 [Myxococcota bacterium]